MDTPTETGQTSSYSVRAVIVAMLFIVAIASFFVGIAFVRYLDVRVVRPPEVQQATPYAPSASDSVAP